MGKESNHFPPKNGIAFLDLYFLVIMYVIHLIFYEMNNNCRYLMKERFHWCNNDEVLCTVYSKGPRLSCVLKLQLPVSFLELVNVVLSLFYDTEISKYFIHYLQRYTNDKLFSKLFSEDCKTWGKHLGCHLQIQFRYSADTAVIPSSSHKTQLLRNFSTLLATAILGNSM